MRLSFFLILAALAGAVEISAQAFEVATVKLTADSNVRPRVVLSPDAGRISITAVTVEEIVQAAYGIQASQLVTTGSPVLKQRVDIVAQTGGPATAAQLQKMLQPLLAERFKLAVHRETREMNALVMTLSSSDGRLGPRMKPTELPCDGTASGANRFLQSGPVPANGPIPCGTLPAEGAGRIIGRGIDMKSLAALLAPSQRRAVVDQTGLSGRFDIDLTYTPEAFSQLSLAQRGGTAPPGVDPDGPPLLTALREQLGLKLESKRVPVEVVVIDRIEPPPEN